MDRVSYTLSYFFFSRSLPRSTLVLWLLGEHVWVLISMDKVWALNLFL